MVKFRKILREGNNVIAVNKSWKSVVGNKITVSSEEVFLAALPLHSKRCVYDGGTAWTTTESNTHLDLRCWLSPSICLSRSRLSVDKDHQLNSRNRDKRAKDASKKWLRPPPPRKRSTPMSCEMSRSRQLEDLSRWLCKIQLTTAVAVDTKWPIT